MSNHGFGIKTLHFKTDAQWAGWKLSSIWSQRIQFFSYHYNYKFQLFLFSFVKRVIGNLSILIETGSA